MIAAYSETTFLSLAQPNINLMIGGKHRQLADSDRFPQFLKTRWWLWLRWCRWPHRMIAVARLRTDFRGPRIIAADRQAPRIYPRMIPLCSRFDSVLFTPKMSAIASYGDYSRSPLKASF